MSEKKPTSKVHKREMKLEIRVGLGDAQEREDVTRDLTNALKATEEIKDEAKEVAKGYREKLKSLKEEIDEAALKLSQGKPEMRDVIAVFDFPNGIVKFQDKETKKFYRDKERAVTDDDRQLAIGDETGETPEAE